MNENMTMKKENKMKNIDKMIIALGTALALSTSAYATCANDVNMGGNTISNVADPVANTDVVNKRFLYDTLKEGYIRDDVKEVVASLRTGLMWQDDAAAETVKKQWLTDLNYYRCENEGTHCEDTAGDTAATYCTDLTLGGYSDWYLPNKEELLGIVKRSTSPSISSVFQHTASNVYWSSTTVAGDSSNAWLVYFSNGDQYYNFKTFSYYVRCVRAGQ